MSSLLFLTTNDFRLAQTGGGTVLYHTSSGFSLMLFFSPKCPHSQKIIPIFKHLPDIVNGCTFGMVNISSNRTLLGMSEQSTTPIKYVPLIILYINGRPYMRYEGPPSENDIRRFILEVSNNVHESGFSKVLKDKEIPAYTIGEPLFGDDNKTYFEFDESSGYHPRAQKK